MHDAVLNLLDGFRSRDATLVADIEAAIRTMPEPNGIDASLAYESSPNLKAFFLHCEYEFEVFANATKEWKPRHFRRLVDEFAKLPEPATYRKMRNLYEAVSYWVQADLALATFFDEKPPHTCVHMMVG